MADPTPAPAERAARGPRRVDVLDVGFDAIDRGTLYPRLEEWIGAGPKRQISLVNVFSVITARRDEAFAEAVRRSDLVLADSRPVVWSSRWLGDPLPEQIAGPDFTLELCRLAAEKHWGVFFLGSSAAVLEWLEASLRSACPGLRVAGRYAPPMRRVFSAADNADMRARVNAAAPDILWVSLTAPKQEKWILENLPHLNCRLAIGVGAAFEFLAGTKKRAPAWMRRAGLEWLHRLMSEPTRLWRRYLTGNSLFLALLALRLVGVGKRGRRAKAAPR